MAELLKQEFDIAVLKAQVGDAPAGTSDAGLWVHFTLQYHDQGVLHDGMQWDFALAEIAPNPGPRGSRNLGPDMPLPPSLVDGLRDWLGQNADGDRPLWVHLVKPYATLRLVPWERALGAALERPILMLPDFIFPRPREAVQSLDVVLCASAPLGYEDHTVREALRIAADRILEGGNRAVRLHVFADLQIAASLSPLWQSQGRLGQQIIVHDNQQAAPYVQEDISSRLLDEAGTLRSPWLLWMRAALAGQGVDVVHFICHGHLSRERGAMLFAQSPLERTETFLAGPVGGNELGTFLTQIGAWSSIFSSLPDDHSEPGLRSLADEIAQSRPGPMMMHVLREDPQAGALAAGYAFLYSLEPHPAPRSTSLFMYCQPYLAADKVARPAPGVMVERGARAMPPAAAAHPEGRAGRGVPMRAIARNAVQAQAATRSLKASPLDAIFSGSERVSSLVASTERYAEQVQLRYQQMARDDLVTKGVAGDAEAKATFETLDKLRRAVADLEAQGIAVPRPAS